MKSLYEQYYSDMELVSKDITFHDSIVTNIVYDPNSLQTILSIELCNYEQSFYKKGEPEIIPVYMEFCNSFFECDREIACNSNMGAIYHVKYIAPRTLEFVISSDEEDGIIKFTILADKLFFRERKPIIETYNVIIAESENYAVKREYEYCDLVFKSENRKYVFIGYFYGDPDFAMIDKNEKFVVMGGCGLIVYLLQEPFETYKDGQENAQWVEIGIDQGEYYDAVEQIDNDTIICTTADGEKREYRISDLFNMIQ